MVSKIILKNKGFLSKRTQFLTFLVVVLVLVGVFAAVSAVYALEIDGPSSAIAGILVLILRGIVGVLGSILVGLISAVIWVSQYNDFINSLAVVNGWVIVRDVANMFFIVVLLIIAFGTILGQEEYHYKKLLPKLLIMAVVVNFSRTIVGVMVDFAQVIMLTFVNGYKAAAGGNFANVFKITQLLEYNQEYCGKISGREGGIGPWEIFGAYLLAFIMVLVSFVTVFIILAVLVLRVIMIWILTILSPIAFLAGTFPQGQKYYAQWWEEFKNQVMVGPMLAFFLWLSLVTVGGGNAVSQLPEGTPSEGQVAFSCSAVGSTDVMISYVIGIFMLLAGVQMSQQMGGMISGIAQKAKGFATKALKVGAAVGLAKPLGFAERKLYSSTGVGLNPVRVVEKYKAYSARRKMIDEAEGAAKAGTSAEQMSARGGRMWGLAGIARKAMGAHADFFEDYMGYRGVKRFGGALAGGSQRAIKIREEAVKLKKDRMLMRTRDEQNARRGEVSSLAVKSSDVSQRMYDISGLIGHGALDTDQSDSRNLAISHLKDLKTQQNALREGGQVAEADAMQSDINYVETAIGGRRGINFNLLTPEVKADFEREANEMFDKLRSEMEKIEGQKIKLQTDIDSADSKGLVFATEDVKKEKVRIISKEINDKERSAAFRTPPRAFYAAENFRSVEAEERKKMPRQAMEATEVVEQFQGAVGEGNKIKAMAWLKKATEDGNDNEIFKGLGYDGGFEGIEQFRKEVLIKQLGMTEQESMAHMSDVNYINEEKGHSNASRMYTVGSGIYRPHSHEEQAAAIVNENLKKDRRKFCQNSNRLAYGYETPDGKYTIDKSGLATIVAMQESMIDRIGKKEMNLNAMNKMAERLDQLVLLERRGLLTSKDKDGRNLREILQDFKVQGPLEEGISPTGLEDLIAKVSTK